MTKEELKRENEELRRRLAEAEDALRAIREGQVDAIVVDGAAGAQIFSLAGAETVYRLVVETMAEATINVSPDGIILFCNARFSEFVATPMERLVGRDLSDFVPTEDCDRLRAMLEQCTRKTVKQRIVLRGPGGVPTPVLLTGNALSHGENVSLCLVAADLTDLESSAHQIEQLREHQRQLEQAHAALRESEQRLRLAHQAAKAGTWEWNLRTSENIWSDELWPLYGIDPHRCAPSYDAWLSSMHPDDRDRAAQTVQAAVAAGGDLKVEWRVTDEDGSVRWLFSRGEPQRDAAAQVVRYLGIVLDITDRKHAENALRESEERLRASLAEKEVLLKEIHHRVKNNMQVISSLVALQAEESGDASMRSMLQEVGQRVRSMALVHEKLYQSDGLARIEFAGYAEDLLRYLWRAHGSTASTIRLALSLQPVSLTVNSAVPFGLILNELVSNALKHAFRGRSGGEVAVSLRCGTMDRVSLCVRDNGTGLPAGFDWREARSLGLRLVQMLAGQLRATVEVSSEGGACFTVTFEGLTKDS